MAGAAATARALAASLACLALLPPPASAVAQLELCQAAPRVPTVVQDRSGVVGGNLTVVWLASAERYHEDLAFSFLGEEGAPVCPSGGAYWAPRVTLRLCLAEYRLSVPVGVALDECGFVGPLHGGGDSATYEAVVTATGLENGPIVMGASTTRAVRHSYNLRLELPGGAWAPSAPAAAVGMSLSVTPA